MSAARDSADQEAASVEQPEVIIIGAGPTGVSAAILLAQNGVRTLVLDRWADVYPQPRAVHLDDEIYRMLGSLGVADDFAAITIPGAGLRLMSPKHDTLASFVRTQRHTANGYPQANMFDQPELEAILRRRMLQLELITFRGNVEVTAVRCDDPDRPVVEFLDKSTGLSHTSAPRFVLGCDGANSLTRASIGSSMKDLGFAPQRWLVVDVASSRDLGQWDGVHQVCDSHRAATYMQVGPSRHRWEFELLDDESTSTYSTLESLRPLLSPWVRDLSGFELLRLGEYTFRAQIADRWRQDGVFILGDAAHLTPPFIGQGMGAGMRDAGNLAWKLAGVLNGSLATDALDTYEVERRPHARSLIRLATFVGRSMTGGGRAGDRLRGVLLPMVVRLPGLRGRVVGSATPALTRSALNRRARVGHGLAGTLCPNIVLSSGQRLDDLAGQRFVLVVRDQLSDSSAARLAARDVVLVTAKEAPALGGWLGKSAAALVRPDRTVSVAGELEAVLEQLPHPRVHS